ncbi:MAG: hypothetical protein WC477_02115 [Patescibacteria group bacterium]
MGKRTDYKSLKEGFGLSRGLSDDFIQTCDRMNVPIEAIQRLVTPQGLTTMENIAKLILTDWRAEQPKSEMTNGDLPPNHYRIRVNRGQLPAKKQLEIDFPGGVSKLFNGSYEWKRHSSRVGMNDVTAEEVVMIVKQFTPEEIEEMGGLESGNIIAWGLKNGLVPADEKETYAFGSNQETCNLQFEFWLVALGSFTMSGGHRGVAVLGSGFGGRILGRHWFGYRWAVDFRFLFVRK